MQASVVIPCRNAERTVADAVRSALEQTEPPTEVLVVDDASTDSSAATARRAGARVIQNSGRRNAGGARNAGIAAAGGDAFAFLDADAIAPRDWLERARRAFESDRSIRRTVSSSTCSRRSKAPATSIDASRIPGRLATSPARNRTFTSPRSRARAWASSSARGEASTPIASFTRGARRKHTSPSALPRSRTVLSGDGSASSRMSRSRSRHLRSGAANGVTRWS